jgi:hypothetical protein
MKGNLYLGSEFKAYIKLDPVGDMTMDSYDFYAEYYCNPNRKVKVEKKDMIRKSENEYWACLNSSDLGTGTLKCDVVRCVPDADFDDGLRTDKITFDFEISILR